MGLFDGLGDFFSLGDEKSSFNLGDLLGIGLQVGGGLLGQSYQNDYNKEALAQASADKLKMMEAELELKKKYGLLGGGGGGGGSGAGLLAAQAAMMNAQTNRAASLAQLYNEMAKQRLLGAQQTSQGYNNLTAAVQGPLLARAR